jgi:hypothetical protein
MDVGDRCGSFNILTVDIAGITDGIKAGMMPADSQDIRVNLMGLLDSILGEDKPQKTAGDSKYTNPFSVTVGFSPLRLSAKRSSCVSLLVKVKNVSPDPQLVSVDALLPRNVMVGFDQACINKAVEKRAGELKPGETKDVSIDIWGNSQTAEGTYPVDVTVFAHYIGYDKVMSYIKKSASLRAV